MKKKFLAGAIALVFLMPSANAFAKEEKQRMRSNLREIIPMKTECICQPYIILE